jgi:hypothetical protein
MKYRKKPVVVEAGQWFKHGDHPAVRHASEKEVRSLLGDKFFRAPNLFERWRAIGIVGTLEGSHIVSPGDWIIQGVKGEFYPCKPDVFAQTYEAVGDARMHHV